ncbi:MAG: alpha/beta hydrolase fold protein [Acidobacteria bacterium]|nr:alpha/beta hydrolase fold protein [Acidobacteriota bacterium]
MRYFFLCFAFLIFAFVQVSFSQTNTPVAYPFPVKFLSLSLEKQNLKMAYMDVSPAKPNGETFILFHGKNFNGFYWKNVIPMLTSRGYRVIVPDQIGWGKSDRPNIHYSFHQLAANNKTLIDSLNIKKVSVLGHSMGGMLATRFALMYPETVARLILENPIGLEDYKTFVPFEPLEKVLQGELKATYDSYKNYQKTYYPVWKPEYEQYVEAQAADLKLLNFPQIAFVNALTFQMIYEQPVVYEFENVAAPTLLIIGQEDRTVVGKGKISKEIVNRYGQYPSLGKKLNRLIKNSRLVELPDVGHIPHIQTPGLFEKAVGEFVPQAN